MHSKLCFKLKLSALTADTDKNCQNLNQVPSNSDFVLKIMSFDVFDVLLRSISEMRIKSDYANHISNFSSQPTRSWKGKI